MKLALYAQSEFIMDLKKFLQQVYWLQAAHDLAPDSDEESLAAEAAIALFDFMVRNGWQAACHATACILTVLFREQGVTAEPCIGECRYPGTHFFLDHSWVETDEGIYDVAVALPSPGEGPPLPPVFAGRAVAPHFPQRFEYGVPSKQGYDPGTEPIRSKSILEFMDEDFEDCPRGKWEICVRVGATIGLMLSVDELREKHRDLAWRERTA